MKKKLMERIQDLANVKPLKEDYEAIIDLAEKPEGQNEIMLKTTSGEMMKANYVLIYIEFDGHWSGKHYPASLSGPEEWPEFELDKVDIEAVSAYYYDEEGNDSGEHEIDIKDKENMDKLDPYIDKYIEDNYEDIEEHCTPEPSYTEPDYDEYGRRWYGGGKFA